MKQSTTTDFRKPWRGVRRRSFRAGSEEGQSLVEFALALPLLAMVLVGVLYGGITFYDYVVLANSVAIGARTVAINRGAGTGPPTACGLGETALKNAAYNLNQSSITIAAETFTAASTCSALVAGDSVTMSATYPCYLTIPFTGANPINLCPVVSSGKGYIKSQTTVRIE